MNSKGTKFVRFEDWKSEISQSSEHDFSVDGLYPRKARLSVREILRHVVRGVQRGYEKIRSLRKTPTSHSIGKKPEKDLESRKKILDPQGSFLQIWNKIFVLSCFLAVSVDPLFFYIPAIDDDNKCVTLDEPLEIIACVIRTFTDIFYVLRIIFQFRTGFIAPSSRVFGRGELVDDPLAIAKRYLSSNFIVDVLSILPLPQIVVLAIIPNIQRPVPLVTKELLKIVIICQYVPRLMRIVPLFKEVTRTSGIITETAWAGAAFNLLLYMLASHAVGAFWYLFSLERLDECWRGVFKGKKWDVNYVYCSQNRSQDPKISNVTTLATMLNASCPFIDPDQVQNTFNFGIFTDALKSGVVESTDFSSKFFYCFWWGLRNLSSLGQNLKTSTFVWEIIFAVFISVFGLILFSLLIGNMQKYLQSTTVRVEEMRVKRRDAEQWMSHRMLPETLRERIRRYEQYKWQETRGVEEETLVRNLPKDLRRDIKRHLCLALLTRVPMFEKMDEQLLDGLCDRLKPALYTEKSSIVREGDPVDEMLFIMRGDLATMTTNGGRTGFFNSAALKAGDFCGEELLTWALDPNSTSNLPTSTRTVVAKTEVEAFALKADDLKFVASQFRRLHSKQLQHRFRQGFQTAFYSLQWRTWGACFIQAAWRRHCKRKLDKSLREAEDRLQDALASEAGSGTTPSLGATIYASRFASNALRALRQSGMRSARPQQRLLPLLPQKPAEPDFTAESR
ncbi:Voltage dependent potassium channel [Parasponia andersonii]|uniref:Voltage dependent potassium channel n=1 Tax=Parasponia andersonii TaxID=3476 RepID=A0A2P5BRB7_PARAD|nr:Voltage dependent potassium channel [Parasponia andersonii]